MRVIKIFFLSLLAIILLGVVFVLAGREIFLLRASSDLKRAYNYLRKNTSLDDCQDGFAISSSAWGQIRFKNETEYNLEAVCSDFTSKPVLKKEQKLPVFVKKIAGGSGFEFIEDQEPQYITLSSLGRSLHLYLEDGEMRASYTKVPELDYAVGPKSSCSAFNYRCCNSEVQAGVGVNISAATDCPKSCYQTCQARPLILSFNARPVPSEQRLVSVRKGQAVTFTYVVSDGKQELFHDQVIAEVEKQDDSGVLEQIHKLFDKETGIEDAAVPPITMHLDFGDGTGS